VNKDEYIIIKLLINMIDLRKIWLTGCGDLVDLAIEYDWRRAALTE